MLKLYALALLIYLHRNLFILHFY